MNLPVKDAVAATAGRIARLLHESVLPFWRPLLREPDGGFRLNHDATGRWLGPQRFALVAQSRLVWVCSRLAASDVDPAFFGDAAGRGTRFLLDRMWDERHGGFFWSLAADGRRPERADKHVYGQAFALMALVERARTTADGEAAARARDLFALLEARAHDDRHGGYVEWFAEDWSPAPAGQHGPLGMPGHLKTLNTHMHMMEATRAYTAETDDPAARKRLVELVLIAASTVQRKGIGYPSDPHLRDWRPVSLRGDAAASYGHMVELAWMLPRAVAAAGLPRALVDDLATHLAATTVRFGLDHDKGGVFDDGPFGAAPTRRTKNWWTQAEALVAFLDRWQVTGDERFAAAYLKTLSWIEERQVDRERGEWHSRITREGDVVGAKADRWKCAYHQVRALLLCGELLQVP